MCLFVCDEISIGLDIFTLLGAVVFMRFISDFCTNICDVRRVYDAIAFAREFAGSAIKSRFYGHPILT